MWCFVDSDCSVESKERIKRSRKWNIEANLLLKDIIQWKWTLYAHSVILGIIQSEHILKYQLFYAVITCLCLVIWNKSFCGWIGGGGELGSVRFDRIAFFGEAITFIQRRSGRLRPYCFFLFWLIKIYYQHYILIQRYVNTFKKMWNTLQLSSM